MELFLDIYSLGCAVWFVHRMITKIPAKTDSQKKIKSFFSVLLLIIISIPMSFLWIFLSWGKSKGSLGAIMGVVFFLGCLNSCSTIEGVDLFEERKAIKEAKEAFEEIPGDDLMALNIAAFKLNKSINEPGIYGFVHKFILGSWLGTSKYKNIYQETSNQWRLKNTDSTFLSPYEFKLFQEISQIAGEEYQQNMDGYKELFELNPENKSYKEKIDRYEEKALQENKKRWKEQCTSKQKSQASMSCASDRVLAYCGIVVGQENVIGSGCTTRVKRNSHQWCVDEVAKVLVQQQC
tara:strand:+ start:109 stop:987 length:879 start_codon:yes stop_codon:yes gene_type:complete